VAKITPGGVITEYDVPVDMRPDHLNGITTGPDGNIWFTDVHGNGLISYMRPDGTFGGSWRPKGTSSPVGITSGPDDTLWYVANGGKVVGRFSLDGKVTVYHLVDESSYVRDTIALGGDGDLWVPVGNTTYAIARVDGS
jgi:virginiamycin B lyase